MSDVRRCKLKKKLTCCWSNPRVNKVLGSYAPQAEEGHTGSQWAIHMTSKKGTHQLAINIYKMRLKVFRPLACHILLPHNEIWSLNHDKDRQEQIIEDLNLGLGKCSDLF